MNKYLIMIIISLVVAIGVEYSQLRGVMQKLEKAEANVRAYSEELSTTGHKNTALQLTIKQFKYSRDSILQELDSVRKVLKVKEKNIRALHQVSSNFSRNDTITLRDTIFKDPELKVDTLLGDEWYTLKLGLHYPSVVTVKPEFKSKKHIIVSSKKETVNPPKKFFLFRWFQRKMTVVHIDVVEDNPYVTGESSKYVEIIK